MTEPTITEVFGINANVSAGGLNISKDMYTELGVPDHQTLTPEGLFVGLVLKARENLTEENRNNDTQNRQVTVVDSGQDLVNQNGVNFRRQAFTVLLYKPEPLSNVNPSDY